MSIFEESLGDFGDMLGGVGREHVTPPDDAVTAAQRAFNDHTMMQHKIARVLGEGEGLEVLRWLKAITLDLPVIPYETLATMTPDMRMAHAHHREGENELVRNIILAIQDSRKEENRDEPEEET